MDSMTGSITEISPKMASGLGGDTLTITGVGLDDTLVLSIGGAICGTVTEVTVGSEYTCVTSAQLRVDGMYDEVLDA